MTTLDRARSIIGDYEELLRGELPEGAILYDVHTHLGHDIDGSRATYEERWRSSTETGSLARSRSASTSTTACPGSASERPNARARGALGRASRPFVRLDLTAQPVEEARRCLDLGARGIKLHPRAQAFALDDERLGPIFELALERGVPILIHGGRGLHRSQSRSVTSSTATKGCS